MIGLNKETVLYLHRLMTAETGGDPNIRDTGLLSSALASPFATFGGTELYPTVEERAARLGYSLISNHAFVDGNKRIGLFAMMIFLKLNGCEIHPTSEDLVQVGLATASGEMKYDQLLCWILENK